MQSDAVSVTRAHRRTRLSRKILHIGERDFIRE